MQKITVPIQGAKNVSHFFFWINLFHHSFKSIFLVMCLTLVHMHISLNLLYTKSAIKAMSNSPPTDNLLYYLTLFSRVKFCFSIFILLVIMKRLYYCIMQGSKVELQTFFRAIDNHYQGSCVSNLIVHKRDICCWMRTYDCYKGNKFGHLIVMG